MIKRIYKSDCNGLDNLITDSDKLEHFTSLYLLHTNNFRAFGYFIDDTLQATISCYKNIYDASWYLTNVIYNDINLVPELLSYCINLHENEELYKFYSLVTDQDNDRKLFWNPSDDKRYIYVDECKIPERTRCVYNHYWIILQERILLDKDYTVRCNFLKQEYRNSLPIGGYV